jgi:nucleotide-binding universal stress UspA family protein
MTVSRELMTIHRILVGTDESDEAAAAASWAAEVGRRHGADLEFLEAVAGGAEQSPARTETLHDLIHARIMGWLAGMELSREPLVLVEHGETVNELVMRAALTEVDLVVIGSLSTAGVTDLALGSLIHQLAHHLSCPVVAVPSGRVALTDSWIVVGVDGSDGSRAALRWAHYLAAPFRAKLCAVYAFNGIYETFPRNGPFGNDEPGARRQVREERVRGDIDFVERSAVHPADALAEVATERGASLVVVAARQRGAVNGLLLGSTPDRLIHEPPCPVAVLPHGYVETRNRTLGHSQVASA